MQIFSGNIVHLLNETIFSGTLTVENGVITDIRRASVASDAPFILPGFIDAHVHIESSMLTPTEFARLAVVHGTVGSVSDPHEIANVLGVEGVKYMLDNADKTPFKCYFGVPSCVPATNFETAGAVVSPTDVDFLFRQYPQLKYLSEMMNFPGVLHEDAEVMEKIAIAKRYGKPIDGHAPGLRGEEVRRYIAADITTDHECFTLEEALDKLQYGMKIIIREGSAAKNFEALASLIDTHFGQVMFCSDDKHPNDLIHSHIDDLVRRALLKGYPLMNVLRCACLNPVLHYGLEVGLLQIGDAADFIIVDELTEKIKVQATYLNGVKVAENGRSLLPYQSAPPENHFEVLPKQITDFAVRATGKQIRVIEALEGQLITKGLVTEVRVDENGHAVSNTEKDVLKLTVVNRYTNEPPTVAFIKNVGLKSGALASSVAHDLHNIIAVGVTDADICEAVNQLIEAKGGLAVVDLAQNIRTVLPLPIAGLMSADDGYTVAEQYTKLDALAKQLGSPLYAPFMTLSFMALLVIPSLKLSDKGLFDGGRFVFTELFLDN